MNVKLRSLIFGLFLAGILAWGIVVFLSLPLILAWFGAVNLVNFLLMGRDKMASTAKIGVFGRRTPERTFFVLALLGGFPGLFAGRRLFQHKTSKRSFVVTMWALFAVQLAAVAFYVQQQGLDVGLDVLGLEKKPLPVAETALQ